MSKIVYSLGLYLFLCWVELLFLIGLFGICIGCEILKVLRIVCMGVGVGGGLLFCVV